MSLVRSVGVAAVVALSATPAPISLHRDDIPGSGMGIAAIAEEPGDAPGGIAQTGSEPSPSDELPLHGIPEPPAAVTENPQENPETSAGEDADVETEVGATSPPAEARPSTAPGGALITIEAQAERLGSILDSISQQSHVAIVLGDDVGGEVVSARFANTLVDEALHDLLARHDAFFYYSLGALRVVWVYGPQGGRGLRPVGPEVWASTREIEAQLSNPDEERRAKAIGTLVERKGDDALDQLLKALQDKSERVRVEALYNASLANVQLPPDLLPHLALNDSSESVRFLALEALADDPNAAQVATRALNDPSPNLRNLAKQILEHLAAGAEPLESAP